MTDLARLLLAAYKTERASALRLAAAGALTHEQALRATLERSAGAAGLPALLAQREALRLLHEERLGERRAQQAAALAQRSGGRDTRPTAWRAWFDGSARPNPGRCGVGGRVLGPHGQQLDIMRAAGYGNSSEAEYRALIAVLEAAVPLHPPELTVYGDSQVVVGDVNGPANAAAASLSAYRAQAVALMAQLPAVTLRWIPRHKNGAADALSQQASNLGQEPENVNGP